MKLQTCLSMAMGIAFAILPASGCRESTSLLPEGKVAVRADDCSDCDSNCCCFVELDGTTTAATLRFCGTLDGASACSSMNCNGITGGGQFITLNTSTPRKLFCMGFSSPFFIENWSSTDEVDIVISCQAESGIPQTIPIHLETNGNPGSIVFFDTDNFCQLDGC